MPSLDMENRAALLGRNRLLTRIPKQPYKKHSRGQRCTYSIDIPVYPAFCFVAYLDGVARRLQARLQKSHAFGWSVMSRLTGFVIKPCFRALVLLRDILNDRVVKPR